MDTADMGVLSWPLKGAPPIAEVVNGLRPWRSRAGSRGEAMLDRAVVLVTRQPRERAGQQVDPTSTRREMSAFPKIEQ